MHCFRYYFSIVKLSRLIALANDWMRQGKGIAPQVFNAVGTDLTNILAWPINMFGVVGWGKNLLFKYFYNNELR